MNNNAPLTAALLMAGIMKKRRKDDSPRVKPKTNYVPKMITGPEQTIRKGMARAEMLGRSFSEHLMRLIEQDYALDEQVVMTVAERTDEYVKFRRENPPVELPPELPRRTESRTADGD